MQTLASLLAIALLVAPVDSRAQASGPAAPPSPGATAVSPASTAGGGQGGTARPAAAGSAALETFDQVRALCESLPGAAGKAVRADVPSKGFALGRERPDDGEIELDGDRPLRTAKDALVLDIAGVDEVAFRGTAEQRAAWKDAKKAGGLILSVVFQPSRDGCRGSRHARQYRLQGRAESWRLLDAKGQVLAASDEDGRPLSRTQGHGARVTSVSFDGEAPLEDEGRSRLSSAQSALDQCAGGVARPGSLVVTFDARGGGVRDVQVVVDGVRDEAVTGCIARAIANAQVDGRGKATATIAVE